MKTSILFIATIILLTLSNFNAESQEIRIDSLFQISGECFPFQGVDSITGLRISGNVDLKSDTSLARVILTCTGGDEFMVFEAYPLIVSDLEFSFSGVCDETCFLDGLFPYSIKIQLVNSELEIGSLYYEQDYQEDLSQLQFASKRAMDSEKIETLNERILDYGMYWTAKDNDIVEMYYDQKKDIFGDAYNVLGYEYYAGGVFEFIGHRHYPKVNPDLVRQFDWRDRHGANDSLSIYWDGDTCGTGWLTAAHRQGSCACCWAFASIGATEAAANLFTTEHLDFDLSEEDILSCSGAGSCLGGYENEALEYIKLYGVVDEICFPYDTIELNCGSPPKCSNPDPILKIDSVF